MRSATYQRGRDRSQSSHQHLRQALTIHVLESDVACVWCHDEAEVLRLPHLSLECYSDDGGFDNEECIARAQQYTLDHFP